MLANTVAALRARRLRVDPRARGRRARRPRRPHAPPARRRRPAATCARRSRSTPDVASRSTRSARCCGDGARRVGGRRSTGRSTWRPRSPTTRSCSPPSAGPRARTTSSRSCATSPAAAASPRSGSRRSRTTTARFGGVSPINDQNRELKAALEAELARRGVDAARCCGATATGSPYLRDALREAHERGFTEAHRDRHHARTPRTRAAASTARTSRSPSRRPVSPARSASTRCASSSTTPASSSRSSRACGRGSRMPRRGASRPSTPTCSSRPTRSPPPTPSAADRRDRDFGAGGAYAAQHLAVAEVVMAAASTPFSGSAGPGMDNPDDAQLNLKRESPGWDLVYQSRSGPPTQPWLEPDINDASPSSRARG